MSEVPLPAAPDEPDALEAFIGKWRARWPEWSVVEVFVPPSRRAAALAWAALQQELTDAAWGGSDPRPGEAKLGWWQDELNGWAQGRRRHPLGVTLQRQPAPWAALAAVLPSLRDTRERPLDGSAAFAQLMPLATVAVAVEQALFDGAAADPATARLVAAAWLQARLAHGGDTAPPLSAFARAGQGDTATEWRNELLREWPAAVGATLPRRLWAAIGRARLLRGAAGRPLPAWAALWTGWRAARD